MYITKPITPKLLWTTSQLHQYWFALCCVVKLSHKPCSHKDWDTNIKVPSPLTNWINMTIRSHYLVDVKNMDVFSLLTNCSGLFSWLQAGLSAQIGTPAGCLIIICPSCKHSHSICGNIVFCNALQGATAIISITQWGRHRLVIGAPV